MRENILELILMFEQMYFFIDFFLKLLKNIHTETTNLLRSLNVSGCMSAHMCCTRLCGCMVLGKPSLVSEGHFPISR